MTVTAVHKDPEVLTMTITSEFAATPDRVWLLWADPRQLERWWGPPTYPATVTAHDLRPGGRVDYFMTGPEGDQHRGYWNVLEVDAPRALVFRDGFADDSGAPNPDLPVNTTKVTIEAIGADRAEMTIASIFPSAEAMEQLIAMGMEEGMSSALGQIDGLLAEDHVPSTS